MSEERKAAERLAVKGVGAILLIGVAFFIVPQIWDKLSPFIISIPLAAMLQPVIRFAERKLKMKRGLSTLICVLLLLGLLFGLTSWVVSIVVEQAPEVVSQAGELIPRAIGTVQRAVEDMMKDAPDEVRIAMNTVLDDALREVGTWAKDFAQLLLGFVVNVATSLPYGVIYISFLAMALYFITIHYGEIRSYLPGGKRRRQDSNTTQLTNSALKSLMGYLRVQGTFALMVFVFSLIALRCFGFSYSAALALLAGIMEMIPMIGSGLLYIVMSIIFFLTGNPTAGFEVLALTGVLQLLRRILEPKLMSDRIGVSPLQSLIGMFAGMRVGGIVGLIGGPVAMSVLVGAVHGDVFKSVSDDMYLVVNWFKKRWSRNDAAAAPEKSAGEETPAKPAPLPEEKTAGKPAPKQASGGEHSDKNKK